MLQIFKLKILFYFFYIFNILIIILLLNTMAMEKGNIKCQNFIDREYFE